MIDIKELRIGNIVNYLEDDCNRSASCKRGVITSLTPKKAIVNGIGIKYCNLLPINLNEKLIRKIGFDFKRINSTFADFRYKSELLLLEIDGYIIDDEKIISYIRKKNYNNLAETEMKCTSLHELQNCFFDITNKELEINL